MSAITGDLSYEIQELVHGVLEARGLYKDRHDAAQTARSLETQSLNALIDMEKELDMKLQALKGEAPPGSHWHSEAVRRNAREL